MKCLSLTLMCLLIGSSAYAEIDCSFPPNEAKAVAEFRVGLIAGAKKLLLEKGLVLNEQSMAFEPTFFLMDAFDQSFYAVGFKAVAEEKGGRKFSLRWWNEIYKGYELWATIGAQSLNGKCMAQARTPIRIIDINSGDIIGSYLIAPYAIQ